MLQKLPNYEVVKFYGNFCGGGGGGRQIKIKPLQYSFIKLLLKISVTMQIK